MLNAITVSNYRGFRDQTELTLRPITVLLGRNSSGKSSLTRLIPLLQQSLQRQSSSPILWASDAVDLGNVTDVINHDAGQDPLTIGFRISGSGLHRSIDWRRASTFTWQREDAEIFYQIRLKADGQRTRFEGISITIEDQHLDIDWDGRSFVTDIRVNNKPYPFEPDSFAVLDTSIFPDIVSLAPAEDLGRTIRRRDFYPILTQKLKEFFHQKTRSEKMDYWAERFRYTPRSKIREALAEIPNVVASRLKNKSNLEYLSDASLINDVPYIIRHIGEHVTSILQSSAYIGPSRASGKRFDRIQELAVNRIDASGLNTAMYLYSLDDEERSSFNDLLISACGHMVEIEESGHGHVSIKVGKYGNPNFENVADVGFGFSQIIPVVAQLHAVQNKRPSAEYFSSPQAIFAVEQPELHLHPAMQANLADLFVNAVDANELPSMVGSATMIIETHSETMISQLGMLVASNVISAEDVAIYFVEKDEISGYSTIKSSKFTDDGIIESWPVGFFSAY